MLASLHGHVETMSLLLEQRADISQQRSGGFSALRAACGNGHVAAAQLLMECGAVTSGEEGINALISACANGQVAVASLLIDAGIPATSTSVDGTTALMQACLALPPSPVPGSGSRVQNGPRSEYPILNSMSTSKPHIPF